MCIRQFAPLRVSSWKDIPNEDVNTMWIFLKDKFNLSNDVQLHAMKQVQLQYKNRHYHLHQSYLKCKDCPNDVNEDDWRWLIENKWETHKFKDQSERNKNNRGNQEIKSVSGTKSIVQIANEMKDKDSNEWPNAVEVWKASRKKSNGTWSVPNGEEIMNKLQEEGEKNKEKILAAPLPLVEHFDLVLKRKSSYARGLGLKGVTSKAQEKILLQAEIEASKKREKNLEKEVAKFKEIAQAALEKQAAEIKQIFAHLASNKGLQNMLSSASPSITSSEE